MSSLISVIEWNTGQSFHSKNLAASYFNIPYSLVTRSIKKEEEQPQKPVLDERRMKYLMRQKKNGGGRIVV